MLALLIFLKNMNKEYEYDFIAIRIYHCQLEIKSSSLLANFLSTNNGAKFCLNYFWNFQLLLFNQYLQI